MADRGGPGKVGRALDAGQPQMQAKLSYLELFKLVHQGLPTAFPIFDKVRELGRGVASLAPQVARHQSHQINQIGHSLGVSEDERTALELPWENRGPEGAGSLKTGYMDKLPEETLLKLFNKVAADFTMFGYTIEDQY